MFKKKDDKTAGKDAKGKDKLKESKEATKKPRRPRRKKEAKPYDPSLNLSFTKGSRKQGKRKGVGPGTGLGKTAGRGQKGQKSRSGGSTPVGFEGGQMPLQRRIPKRGFVNIHKENYSLVNILKLKNIDTGSTLNKQSLLEKGIISSGKLPVKLLGFGEIEKPVVIEVDKASKSAIAKIEKAGGKVVFLEKKKAPRKGVKKDKNLHVPRKDKKLKKLASLAKS